MKFRGTLVTLAIAALLGGYVYWHEVRGGRERTRARAQQAKLLGIEPVQVQALRVVHSGTLFNMKIRNNTWVLTQPVGAPCDSQVISAFLDTLAQARCEERLGHGNMARYGLDAPAARLEIDAGGRTRVLRLGRLNPLQTLVYALVDDSDDVVLTTSALLSLSLNGAFGWRDKRVIDVAPEQVQRLLIRTLVTPPMTLRCDARLGWLVDGDVPWRVDPVRARGAVAALSHLNAVGVAAENKMDLGSYGLTNRRFGVQLERSDGTLAGDLVFGWVLNEGAYFAMVPDKPEVFQVEQNLAELVVSLARDPRDRKALPPFDPSKITRLHASSPEDEFDLRRDAAHDWVVVSSRRADRTLALDPGRIAATLEGMSTLEISGFPAQQPPRSAYDPPVITVMLYAGDTLVSGIEIGRKDPKGMLTFAHGAGEPAAFLLSPATLINLPFDLQRLKADEMPAPAGAERG